ncbi:hypothetical protein D3C81_2097230 [compost metagenome]
MAQLMLDDPLGFFTPEHLQLHRVDLNVMAFDKISSSRGAQPAVKAGFVAERNTKAVLRHLFDPLLQLFIAHSSHRFSHKSSPQEFMLST